MIIAIRSPHLLACILAASTLWGTVARSQSLPVQIDTHSVEIDSYADGDCFLDQDGIAPLKQGERFICAEFSWFLTNPSRDTLRDLEISDSFQSVLDHYDGGAGSARIERLAVIETNGITPLSFEGDLFQAAVRPLAPEDRAAIRLRIQFRAPATLGPSPRW